MILFTSVEYTQKCLMGFSAGTSNRIYPLITNAVDANFLKKRGVDGAVGVL